MWAPEPAIAASCEGVVKIFWSATGEVHALKGIDAVFPEARVTAVVGPSGSGKSSLLRILAMVDPPTAGHVRIGDRDLSGVAPMRLRRFRRFLVGYMFQRPTDNLVPYLTVREHLENAARVRGREAGKHADAVLDRLGIASKRRNYPHQLSGGEQQRVGLAQALVGRPTLMVADEPTAELDSESARALMSLVDELAEEGQTFVLATHDPLVVEVSDLTIHLRHGTIEAETLEGRQLAVVDPFGRVQLPPGALQLFPGRRAVIHVEGRRVWIDPP